MTQSEAEGLAAVRGEALKCCRCGQCRSVCPTFAELRDEANAPRGRVTTVAAVQEGQIVSTPDLERSITQCTLCLACVSECPSGVDLERIFLEARRELADRLGVSTVKGAALNLVARHNRLLPAVARMAWAGQWLAGSRLPDNTGLRLRFPAGSLGSGRLLPAFARVPLRSQLPTVGGQGGTRGRVAYFTGCFDNYFDPAAGKAVSKVLTLNGYQVIVPPDQGCCALPMLASGLRNVALGLMRDNVTAMLAARADVIVTACASCGSALRNLYVDTFEAAGDAEWAEKASQMAALTMDVSELLVERGYEPPGRALDRAVTYHDPCHLSRGQNVARQPRDLLRSIPGVELVEHRQPDRCCGGGGTFSFSHPELAQRVQDRKIANIADTRVATVVTGCPGCKLHLNDGLLRAGSPARVAHTIQLLAEAYG